MTLPTHNLVFKRRLVRLERSFLYYYTNPQLNRYERWFRLEGLISQTWQTWCQFCRAVIIDSCLGTEASGGRIILRAKTSWVDAESVSYEVKRAANGQATSISGRITLLRQEITWGDIDKLVTAIGVLSPSNAQELLGGFGSGLTGPKHIQLVRNSSAHINKQNFAAIRSLAAYYYGSGLNHPTDIAIWSHIITRDPAYISWTSDMKTMADLSIL